MRSFWKNKGYSFLNILGLAIGIACAGLIFLWVEDETNYDAGHLKKDRLFLVKIKGKVETGVITHSSTPGVLAPAMQQDMPGIANTCRVTEDQTSRLFSIGDKSVYASGRYAEASLFNMFTLPFVQGNTQSAFAQLYSLVITEKTARKFFGNEQHIIGKTVRADNKQDYVVTGVVKDLPENSSLQFEWVSPFQLFYQNNAGAQRWENFCINTYVELKPGVVPTNIDKQLYDYIGQKQGNKTSGIHAFLFGMNKWRLYDQFDNGKETGGGRIQYVHLFSMIAWIILFIACINFMNLATARSEKRAREVGVRKVLGAGKKGLVLQFIGEAIGLAMLGALGAVVIIAISLPAFNILVQKNLTAGFDNPVHIIALFLLTLFCGLVAGSYPSFYLSSFNPVFVLKGIKARAGSATLIRKGLVVAQFTVSIVLIIGTIIIYQQIQHVKSRNLGFNKDNLIQMKLQGDMIANFSVIKHDLINTGSVENVALTDHETISGGNNTTALTWPGKKPGSIFIISQRLVSPEFISTAGMQLTAGRDFEPGDMFEIGNDGKLKDSTRAINILITESMEKLMGEGPALGKVLHEENNNGTINMVVKGVVKDYIYGDMYGKPDPVVFFYIPKNTQFMYVRTKAHVSPEQALADIGSVIKKDNAGYPFEYTFVDDQFNSMFMSEMLISKLSNVFAALAIFISCLGLFGLAAYTAERRTKEIGVRKVLGASLSGIAGLLSKDFIQLVAIACLVAFPLAAWIMHGWLQNYQYRVDIKWWIFCIAGAGALFIALLTVSFQAIKAAAANPVKSLRTE